MFKFGIAVFMMLSIYSLPVQAGEQCRDRSVKLTIIVMNLVAAEKAQLEKLPKTPENEERIAELSLIVRALFDASIDEKNPGATYTEITNMLAVVAESRDAKDAPALRPLSSPVLVETRVRRHVPIF